MNHNSNGKRNIKRKIQIIKNKKKNKKDFSKIALNFDYHETGLFYAALKYMVTKKNDFALIG